MTSTPSDIRPFEPSDREAVLATVRAAELLPDEGVAEVAGELDAQIAGEPGAGEWLVDRVASGVAGVAFFAPERMTDRTWNLLMLAVHPDHQGQGRGSALVRAVERDLRSRGARLLVIETSGVPDFAGQRQFYTHLGYAQQGWVEDFYADGDAKVMFAKPLSAASELDA